MRRSLIRNSVFSGCNRQRMRNAGVQDRRRFFEQANRSAVLGSHLLVVLALINLLFPRIFPGWPIAIVAVPICAAFGLGIDLSNNATRTTIVAGFLFGLFGASVIYVSQQFQFALTKAPNPPIPVMTALEIYTPLIGLLTLTGRWAARSTVRRQFDRGTARFDSSDLRRRRDLIAKFLGRRRD